MDASEIPILWAADTKDLDSPMAMRLRIWVLVIREAITAGEASALPRS